MHERLIVFLSADVLDLDRQAVRNLLMNSRQQLLANHFSDSKLLRSIRDHFTRKQRRTHRQPCQYLGQKLTEIRLPSC